MRKKLYSLAIIIFVILLHQFTQATIFNLLNSERKEYIVLPFFNLVKVWNTGISFGMFQTLPYGQWLLSGISAVIVAILLRWLWRSEEFFVSVALSMIVGGALGNFIDRVRVGAVADYLDFHFGDYHWPAFNFTDTAICVGVLCIIVSNFYTTPAKKKHV